MTQNILIKKNYYFKLKAFCQFGIICLVELFQRQDLLSQHHKCFICSVTNIDIYLDKALSLVHLSLTAGSCEGVDSLLWSIGKLVNGLAPMKQPYFSVQKWHNILQTNYQIQFYCHIVTKDMYKN